MKKKIPIQMVRCVCTASVTEAKQDLIFNQKKVTSLNQRPVSKTHACFV